MLPADTSYTWRHFSLFASFQVQSRCVIPLSIRRKCQSRHRCISALCGMFVCPAPTDKINSCPVPVARWPVFTAHLTSGIDEAPYGLRCLASVVQCYCRRFAALGVSARVDVIQKISHQGLSCRLCIPISWTDVWRIELVRDSPMRLKSGWPQCDRQSGCRGRCSDCSRIAEWGSGPTHLYDR